MDSRPVAAKITRTAEELLQDSRSDFVAIDGPAGSVCVQWKPAQGAYEVGTRAKFVIQGPRREVLGPLADLIVQANGDAS